ncbi:hypothetical protein VST04_21935 [Bacillus paranthracis]|uniref:hypothetical protein n=1 Tax=Bacillus paranthracis TaxID=2026186 RepID=UPI002DD42FFD|nr:hypothetical protein [Bacillus paranthracis]MEC4620770.1 hypothetical protein [Bacillus paranthracis]
MIFTSYSGCDMIPVLNGQVLGAVSEVKYTERFVLPSPDDLSPVVGTMNAIIFDREPIKPYMNRKGKNEFIIFFMNEYEQKLSIRFEGFRFTKREGGFQPDDLVLEETYHFECDEIVFDNETPYGQLGEEHDCKFGYKEKVVESA